MHQHTRGIRVLLLVFIAGLYAPPTRSSAQSAPESSVHMWVGASALMDAEPEVFRSTLAFAARHDIIPYNSGSKDPVVLRQFLEQTRAAGIEKTWLEIGPGKEFTVREFVEDPVKQAVIVEVFREAAREYNRQYPEFGRITIFDEAPLGGFQREVVDGKMDYRQTLAEFREYAPQAFGILYRAIKEEMPNAEVGIFMHHPHNASPAMGGEYSVIEEFMEKASALGATPDFIYSDVYRGWLTRGFGTERTNAYIQDVVSHTNAVAERYGVEAHQLGQMHTIKLGHTPSRWEIDTNIAAMIAGGADGIGWYWPNTSATDHLRISRRPDRVDYRGYPVNFQPFIPNSVETGADRSVFGQARDRFVYSYLGMVEATGGLRADERFDLWLYGYDFDHVEHDVYLKDSQGEWEYLGAINAQQDASGYAEGADAEHLYSYADRSHAVVFHALKRDRFLDDGEVEVRIETPRASDGSTISAIYAMPYRETRNYLTEPEVTLAIEEHPRWTDVNSLVGWVRPRPSPLGPEGPFGATLRVRGTVDPGAAAAGWERALRAPPPEGR